MSEGTSTSERPGEGPLRLALISTPRSGNTWARALLATLYGLEEIPVHRPDEIDWEDLPRRCVIQIHWYHEDPFIERLARHGVRPVVMARHPLDVLMSWLNYSYYVHQEGFCPGQGACLDCPIVGVLPRSEAFLQWTRTEYARCFLYYSPSWWEHPGAIQVRYEDLVADPESALARVAGQVGEPPRRPVAEAVEAHEIGRRKPGQDVWHFHYWQGQPGLWREFLPAAEARAIAAAIPEPFAVLGYDCDPREDLEPVQADQNWTRLQLDSTREHLRLERTKHRKTVKDLLGVREQLDQARDALRDEARAHAEARRMLDEAGRGRLIRIDGGLRPALRGLTGRVRRIASRLRSAAPRD